MNDPGSEEGVPSAALAADGLLVVRRAMAILGAVAAVLATAVVAGLFAPTPIKPWIALAEVRRSGFAAWPLGAVLVALAGLAGAGWMAEARLRAARADAALVWVGRAARVPQILLVAPAALVGAALAWWLRPLSGGMIGGPELGLALGGAAVALAFPLLVAERMLAGVAAAALPEAAGLRALVFVAAAASFAAGLLEIGAALGLPYAGRIGAAGALVVAAVGVELAARALARFFLPPPAAGRARGASTSLLARLIAVGAAPAGGIEAPIRQHLGIDFSRSWALGYVRAAAVPMLAFFGALAWTLSGVVLVPLDQRAVYERFGAPVRVLHPGLHVILPWPLGATRRVEFGTVHEIGLTEGSSETVTQVGAEDLAPASSDRLWEQAHPSELILIIASRSGDRQSFQSVAADIRVLYQVGLGDASALRSAYAAAVPEALVRAASGRVVAAYFAQATLDGVLGANREAAANLMRTQVQAALDQVGSGLEAVAVVIEAIHPPAGAADAYHNVRAAEIAANASIAVEHGAAATVYAQSRQYAFDQTSQARAAAAEAVGAARTGSLRFTADREAARVGGQAFLTERYFSALNNALGKAPKTIVDHRLNYPEAPVLDLRPMAAAVSGVGGKEE